MAMKKIVSTAAALAMTACLAATAAVPALAAPARTPRYTVVALDVSGSMDITDDKGVSSLQYEKDAAKSFCDSVLKNEDDKIAIVKFDDSASQVCEFTNDLDLLHKSIDELETWGGTDFTTAFQASKSVLDTEAAKGVKFERNIVFCSDGLPEYGETLDTYEYTAEDLGDTFYSDIYLYANAALKYDNEQVKPDTTVYTIGFYTTMTDEEKKFPTRLMKDLSSGGSSIASTPEELVEQFNKFAEDITAVETVDEAPAAEEATYVKSPQTSDAASRTVVGAGAAVVMLGAVAAFAAKKKEND